MNNRAIIYVTDLGFLYPSLVSASQIKSKAEQTGNDILMYLINVPDDARLAVEGEFPYIKFIALSDGEFELPEGVFFKKDHVAMATLGRLVLYNHIPVHYEHIAYIDGDTQIVGDATGLLTLDVPLGHIAAGRGGLWLSKNETGPGARTDRQYVKTIGTTLDEYFNAGVLAFRRETLRTVGPNALRYFFDNSKICRQHDQSALNATCHGRVVYLWPGYNFHNTYQALDAKLRRAPAIVHFTGPLKPWLVRFGPSARFSDAYDEFDRSFPQAAKYRKRLDASRIEELHTAWKKANIRSSVLFWRRLSKRSALADYANGFA